MGSAKASKTNASTRVHDPRPKSELIYWYERDPKTGGLRLKHRKDAINRD